MPLIFQMVSTKFYSGYDEDIFLSDWAEYGNISVDRLKELELDFLCAIDWKVYVSHERFFRKLREIERVLATKETTSRAGVLTYTELCTLMPSIEILRKVISYSCLLAVSYTAGILALWSAFFVATQVPGSYLYESAQSSTAATVVPTHTENVLLEAHTEPASECGTDANSSRFSTNNMTEFEQRLILDGIEWGSVSDANEDGTRIHLNSGTDYWRTTSWSNDSNDTTHDRREESPETDGLSRIESIAHGTIRKRENDSELDLGEWSPYRTNNYELSFLSYLWLKFV